MRGLILATGAAVAALAFSSAAGAAGTGTLTFGTDSSWTVNGSPAAVIDQGCYAGFGAWTTALGINWIGVDSCPAPPAETDTYSKTFDIPGTPTNGTIEIAADNEVSLYVNGTNVLSQTDAYDNFHLVTTIDVTSLLHSGSNTIDAVVTNTALSVSGVVARVSVAYQLPDTLPPSDAPVAPSGWNNSDVTVDWNWTDDDSGIDASNCTQSSTSSGEGAIVLTSSCSDLAGNPASDSVTVYVDKTAPVAAPVAPTGWHDTDQTVAWNWTDAGGSGVDAANCTQSSTSTGEGTLTLTASCSDVAGNAASASATVQVDTTAPTVTYTGGGTYTVDENVSIACSASDALSGVASDTCADVSGPAWSLGLGTHALSATATDNAGNTGSGSTSYTVVVDAGSLCALVERWAKNRGIANSLCTKIRAAEAADARGQSKTKRNDVAAFDHEVAAQSGKGFTSDQAALLVELAAAL
ncbi:MAG TPA: hypothetical protein VFJ77_05100 [Gaiellaceae bacterium]|nr:hypothetical protein [Gaiellaceae bacterium]